MIEILTEREAAEILRITPRTLRNARIGHKISAFKQGRDWFYLPEDIENYIKRGKICAASPGSSSSQTSRADLNPPTGISVTTKEEIDACLRGVSLARKTMKRTSRSLHLHSKEKSPPHGSQIN